ncbi:hypothetical protein [Buttiauxella sp. S19-1]|uniref:hypothetical protein n=1 Tax=Buttiauxella sp. S19-1 TaxID=941430 RepID=UPI001EDA6EC5|nr:hypothetical protein [Buttiauxella sp. S19-1]
MNKMLLKRRVMQVLYPKCVDQDPANPEYVYELTRLGNGQYRTINMVTRTGGPEPDGKGWVFVIMEDAPNIVICGKADYENVHGHTSLTGMMERNIKGKIESVERGVYFAGELTFRFGKLIRWSNSSGHFLPKRELAFMNIPPSVKYILPIDLFKPDDKWF